MTRCALTFLLAPAALRAQLALFAVTGGAETPVPSTYSIGSVAAGDVSDVRFRARNSGNAAVLVTKLAISGSGFSITSPLTLPPAIAPGNFLDVFVHFAGGPPASYSANFQINGIAVLVLATSVPAPVVTVSGACTGPDPSARTIDFGKQTAGQSNTCTISLRNANGQTLQVSNITLAGSAFYLPDHVSTPLTILPGASVLFSLTFAPTAAAVYQGLLSVDTRNFPLTGTGVNPPLPTPILDIGPGPIQSAQQRTLTMRLSQPSPVAASGSVNLSFQSDSIVGIADPGVMFVATGARSVPFEIQPGETQILLGGQPEAIFQTGTSSGKIRFTVTANVTLPADPAIQLSIPPQPVSFDNATATRRLGNLDVQIWGFDNTYSAGAMSFTFYDLAGNEISPGAVRADFTSDFRSYFTQAQSGSAFQMRVTFPVTGDSGQVAAVDVQMTNLAGSAAIQRLTFK